MRRGFGLFKIAYEKCCSLPPKLLAYLDQMALCQVVVVEYLEIENKRLQIPSEHA